MAAVAHHPPHVQLPLALRTRFRPLSRAFDLGRRFFGAGGRAVRPHHGTLRMDAAWRIGCLPADRTDGAQRADQLRLRMVHDNCIQFVRMTREAEDRADKRGARRQKPLERGARRCGGKLAINSVRPLARNWRRPPRQRARASTRRGPGNGIRGVGPEKRADAWNACSPHSSSARPGGNAWFTPPGREML